MSQILRSRIVRVLLLIAKEVVRSIILIFFIGLFFYTLVDLSKPNAQNSTNKAGTVLSYLTWIDNALQGELGNGELNEVQLRHEYYARLITTAKLLGYSLGITVSMAAVMLLIKITMSNVPSVEWCLTAVCGILSLPIIVSNYFFFYALPAGLVTSGVYLHYFGMGAIGGVLLDFSEWIRIDGESFMIIGASVLLALSSGVTVELYRIVLKEMNGISEKQFVISAGIRGGSPARHIIRASLPMVVSVILSRISVLLGLEIIAERLMNVPGLGWSLIESLRFQEYPMTNLILVTIASVVILVQLGSRISNIILNPKPDQLSR